MRRGLTLACVALIVVAVAVGSAIWWGAGAVNAAPAQQGFVGVITAPQQGSSVRGTISIEGTASHGDFWKYEVHYGRGASPSNWVLIGDVHTNTVSNGRLEVWNTGLVPDGIYTLRLRVVRRDGNFEDVFTREIRVANTTPTDTPVPPEEMPTPAEAATATPLPASPTVVIEQPKRETPTVTATATVQQALAVPTSTPAPMPSISGSMLVDWLWSGARIVFIIFGIVLGLVIIRALAGVMGRALSRWLKNRRRKDDDLDD